MLKNKQAKIKIQQAGRLQQRILRKGDRITIGMNPENDVVLVGKSVPRKYVLLERRNSNCILNLRPGMDGQIWVDKSCLTFSDLLAHDLLPKRGDSHILTVPPGREGFIKVGDAHIEFTFVESEQKTSGLPSFGWAKASRNASGRDLLFKFLLTLFIALEAVFHLSIRGIEIKEPERADITKVSERFAKFVVQPPPKEVIESPTGTNGATTGASEEGKKSETSTKKKSKAPKRGSGGDKPVSMKGVLGLIGGLGDSQQNSDAIGFLIDQGMVKELDQMLGNATLKAGRGNGRGSGSGIGDGTGDVFDDILAVGSAGGIDDLISDVDGVETVSMKKQGRVEIQQPSKMTGSQEAMGQRSPESIRAVINSQEGRIKYTFNKYLRRNPNLRGKVSLDVTIKADGSVGRVTLLESTVGDPDFVRDIMNIIRRLKFPAIAEGEVTVNLPFVFQRIE